MAYTSATGVTRSGSGTARRMDRYNRAAETTLCGCKDGLCTCKQKSPSTASLPHYSASESILDGDIRDALDSVNPTHYTRLDPEPIDVIESWGLDYREATALKYLSRHRHKGGAEDIRKAIWFLERILEYEYNGN